MSGRRCSSGPQQRQPNLLHVLAASVAQQWGYQAAPTLTGNLEPAMFQAAMSVIQTAEHWRGAQRSGACKSARMQACSTATDNYTPEDPEPEPCTGTQQG
jgi:hypothetical protein